MRQPILQAVAFGAAIAGAPLAAQDVSGFENPFRGNWIAQLTSADGTPGIGVDSIRIFLSDTMFVGRFPVFSDPDALARAVGLDDTCGWDRNGFAGKFYWDAYREPILSFVEVYRALPDTTVGECAFIMRLLAKPDSSLAGWWCQGKWDACRQEGAATLRRLR